MAGDDDRAGEPQELRAVSFTEAERDQAIRIFDAAMKSAQLDQVTPATLVLACCALLENARAAAGSTEEQADRLTLDMMRSLRSARNSPSGPTN